MIIACLDLEGVLVPEVWINVAERTGIRALRRTTRDEPDYELLMTLRILRARGSLSRLLFTLHQNTAGWVRARGGF